MNADRNNLPSLQGLQPSREPLPAEFGADLARVDDLLGRAVMRSASAPAGLSQHVFEMSIASLGGAHAAPARVPHIAPLRLVATGARAKVGAFETSRQFVFAAWARLALAASVLVVAGLSLWVASPKVTPALVAERPTERDPLHSVDASVLNMLNYDNPHGIDSVENDVEYLLEASQVRSFADLNSDLLAMVRELEM